MYRLIDIYNFYSHYVEMDYVTVQKKSTDTWMRNLILTHPESIYTFEPTFAHLEAGEMDGKQHRRDLFTRYVSVTFVLITVLRLLFHYVTFYDIRYCISTWG
jgi:hypothetical protein